MLPGDKVQISIPRKLREKLRRMKNSKREAYYEVIEDILRVRATTGELGEPGSRTSLVVEVEMLWSPSEKQKQVGLLRDKSGIVKFVSWEGSSAPRLKEGETYLLRDLLVDEFNEEKWVKLDSKTSVREAD